jgi:ribonuclease E
MKKRILINALHSDEKRVAIVEGDTLVDFYVEALAKEPLRGNIYKGVIMRIEPGLQAAFVDFGQKKHGFLQMREIRSDYFKNVVEGKRPRVQDVLSKGQELIVQVEKDERDTKGASLTTYLSIPGRYLVMMPGQERVGISRKIEDREERDRLKEMFGKLKLPKDMGFILRTAGSEKTSEELSNDLKYLTKLWNKIQNESEKVAAPALIYKEQDIAVRTVRDYLTDDVTEVLIDEQEALRNTKEFLKKTLPWRKINVKLYKETKPIFARYNIEEQIAKIYDRYVYLPSRGYLVIDRGEALTAIDVNSGRSRKEENIEATALKTNIEAADEVARQLRLRDIGGLIVIDFIDMESFKNRREVENRLKNALSADKAHADVSGISKFGLVEMTRERLRSTSFESVFKRCEVCGGTGAVKTAEMTALSAFRDMQAKVSKGGIKGILCSLPVESMNYLVNTKRDEIGQFEKEFKVPVRLEADTKLFSGQYTIAVEKSEEEKSEDEGKKAEHKAEETPEHKIEHKEEQKTEHRAERTTGHAAEQGAEPKKRPKRRFRSRGRRRPRHGAKPGVSEGGMSGPVAETTKSEAEGQGGETSAE